jgi:TRAP-type C4-dicarboxylate transport system permease small subunit
VRALSAAVGRLSTALALAAAWLLLAMVALISLNIVMRNLGLGIIAWTDEVSEYALYAVTLLTAPWLLRLGGHVRVDLLLATLPASLGWALEAAADLVGLAVCLIVAWYGAAATGAARAAGAVTVKGLVFPEWWVLAPLPLAFLLLAVEFVLRLHRLLTGPRQPSESIAGGLS